MTSLSEFQKQVDEHMHKNGLLVGTECRILELVARVGELAHSTLRSSNYGRYRHVEGAPDNWDTQLANILLSVISLANIYQYDLESALEKRIKKLQEPSGNPNSPRPRGSRNA